jgi:iron complex outermembrane receptor protein
MRHRSRLGLIGLCLGAPISAALPATAQTTPPVRAQAAEAPQDVDEVVVTAERRESSIREVGFSIMAVSGETMRDKQVTSADDLTQLVPGISLTTTDKSVTIVQIRGSLSTFRTATLDAPIAFFVDDVYYPSSVDLNTNFYDLNHVEILRGPQGTLFGRNVNGGATVVVTNNPSFEPDYLLSLSGGTGGAIRTEGMVNGAIIDGKVAGRLAFSTDRTRGLIDTPNLSGNFGRAESASARGKLLFTPSESLRIIVSADYTEQTGSGSDTELKPLTRTGVQGGIPASLSTFGAFIPDKWTVSSSRPSPFKIRSRGVSAHVDWEVLGGSLTSITSYRATDMFNDFDNVGVAGYNAIGTFSTLENRWFTQEVRFASAPGRLSYVVGGFYLHGDYHTINEVVQNPLPGSALAPLYTINPFYAARDQTGDVDSVAVFGEGVFQVTDQLSLTVGGRVTRDQKDMTFNVTSRTNDPTGTPQVLVAGYTGPLFVSASKSWTRFTPRVVLKYKPTEDINLYALYSRGFKSGGWIDNAYNALGATLPLEPENSTNWEAGIKSRLFDRRLDLNVSAFEQKTKGLQNFSGAGGVSHVFNSDSRVRGVEVESTGRITEALTLGLNYAYYDGIYTSLVDPATPTVDNSGNPLKYLPKHSFTASASYRHDLAQGGSLTAQADFKFATRVSSQDSFSTKLYPRLYDWTRARTLNARLSYESENGRYQVTLWGKNLTNNYQVLTADDVTPFLPTVAGTAFWKVQALNPRTVGVTFTARR